MRNPVQRAVARHIRGLQCAAFVSAAFAMGAAHAADKAKVLLPTQYFNYGVSYSMHDDPVDYGIGFDLGYGKSFSAGNWLEGKLSLAVLETGSDTLPDFYQTTIGADYLRSLGNESLGHFFALVGGGLAMNDVSPDSEDGSSYYLNAGLGYRTRVSTVWGVRPRVELRYVRDSVLDGIDSIVVGVKLEIPPNRQSVVEKTVEVEKIVEVPVEVEKIVEKESTCVIPPVETPPADTDGDGVLDSADQCPGTPRGTAVDATGCTRKGSITLQGVNFDTNAATLTADSRPVLDAVAADLKKYPRLKVEVQGHTDNVGADAYNLGLSQRRATSVREYLVAQGVAADQLTAKGYGESQPVSDNSTPAGRKENRRVVLSVLSNPGDVEVQTR